MKRVYLAANLPDAQLTVDTLATQGIKAHIFNANAVGCLGELAATQIWPEVWVEKEENPGNFLSCRNCGQALG